MLRKKSGGETLELCASLPKVKDTWMETIKQQLDNQLDFLNGNAVALCVLYKKKLCCFSLSCSLLRFHVFFRRKII